jgi:hypothetical protein
MKRGLSIACAFLVIIGMNFAQEGEILGLKEKIIDLQNNGDLGFTDFIPCSEIMGFASYVPLSEPVIDKNGTLLIYYEPANVFTNKRDGLYEIWYTQDMTILTEDSEVISHWNDILTFHYMTKKPVMDLFAQNSIDLKGQLQAGKYKFKATLKDKLSKKTATHIINFEIR